MKRLIFAILLAAIMILPMTALAGSETYLYSTIGGGTSIYGAGETGIDGLLDLNSHSNTPTGLTAINNVMSVLGNIQANPAGIGLIGFNVNDYKYAAEEPGYAVTSISSVITAQILTMNSVTATLNVVSSGSGVAANY